MGNPCRCLGESSLAVLNFIDLVFGCVLITASMVAHSKLNIGHEEDLDCISLASLVNASGASSLAGDEQLLTDAERVITDNLQVTSVPHLLI